MNGAVMYHKRSPTMTVKTSDAKVPPQTNVMNLSVSGTAQAFEHDETAAALSLEVISKGWDTKNYTFEQRLFAYLPLMHSEKIEVQVRFEEGYVSCLKYVGDN